MSTTFRVKERKLYTESVHVRLSKELVSECWQGAARMGVGFADFIRVALISYIAEIKNNEKGR